MNDLVTVDRLRDEQEAFVDAIVSTKGANLPANIEEIVPILAFSSAKAKAYQAICDAAGKVEQQERLNEEALASGQRWGIVHLYGQKRLGELTREMPTYQGTKKHLVPGSHEVVTKEQQLASAHTTKKIASDAERIAAHPEVLERVITESEERKEIPTKTAVLREIRREQDKATRQEIDRHRAATADQARAVAPIEVQTYMSKLMKVMATLPAEPPSDGWDEPLLQEARGYARVIINRLRRFADE